MVNVNPNIRFEDWEVEQMQDPEFRAAVEKLEPAYETACDEILGSDAKWWYSRCALKRGAVETNDTSEAASIIQQLLNCLPDSDSWKDDSQESYWNDVLWSGLNWEAQRRVKRARHAGERFLASINAHVE